MPASNGDVVRVHYRGTLVDGAEFDSSEGRSPLEFAVGSGSVIAGFDEAVTGLEVGESRTVRIEPEDAYGGHNPDLVHNVEAEVFDGPPYVGAEIELIAPDGSALPGRITAVEADRVIVDFNHPLAGEILTFEITLVEILPAE